MLYRFTWILPERLAGMAHPGLFNSLEDDRMRLLDCGITHIITLTEQPLSPQHLSGFCLHHFPVKDMGIPDHHQTEAYCRIVDAALADQQRVAVHCHAGIGRTGTFLAAYLIWSAGLDASVSIHMVRQHRLDYVQSLEQAAYLEHWANHLAGRRAS